MIERSSYAKVQKHLEENRFEEALRAAGPLLEEHPDNLPAWYQVATAAAHIRPGEDTIKNLEHAAFALVRGQFPLQGIISMSDDLVPPASREKLLQELITGYSLGAMSDKAHLRQSRQTLSLDAAPWSELLPVDELCRMADSLCAVAWGNSLETIHDAQVSGYLSLFSSLSSESFAKMVDSVSVIHAKAGDTLVSVGARSDALSIIAYGHANGEMSVGHGQLTRATLVEGDIVGEESLLTGNPETTAFVAAEPCTLLRIPTGTLYEIAASEPELALTVAKSYQKRILESLLDAHPLLAMMPIHERASVLRQMRPIIAKASQPVNLAPESLSAAAPGALFVFSGSIHESGVPGTFGGELFCRGDWISTENWESANGSSNILIARENTVTLKLSREAFHDIISKYPQLKEAMFRLRDSE